ncbi:MAG: HD domain-containing protein [bacterium]|nr:HD domain-containing protein [bacterium]
MTKIPNREEGLALLKKYNNSASLINHALSVEAVMRYYAIKNNEDEEKWGVIGLIHDLDYDKYPDKHCIKTKEILEKNSWPEDYIRAVVSHGWEFCSDVEPKSLLEKTLYTIDELTGFITACALVRPSKSVMDLELKSVRKKWKIKTFAAGANRDVIEKGSKMLNIDLNELINDVIQGMRTVAEDIGL